MQLQQIMMQIMASNQLDALVYPHQKRLVVPIGETQVERNGVLASIVGFPAITVPAGFSPPKDTAPLGVPIGIEFMGRPWSEPNTVRLSLKSGKVWVNHEYTEQKCNSKNSP